MATIQSLKGLAESKANGIQKATYFKVNPTIVEFEEGFNLREEGEDLDAHIERLYLAMKEGAFIPPIDVSVIDGRIIARDGHCRTRAARRLVADGIDYQLEARQLRGNEADSVIHMLGTGHGRAYTPLEQGRGFLRLIRFGLEVATIAQKIGVSRSTVENGLALAEAPVAVQALVSEGKVSSHFALQTIRAEGSKATETLNKAIQTAKDSGKDKATAKHVEKAPPATKAATYPIEPPPQFKEYMAANYSGDVSFADSDWHAERIWNAACKSMKL